MIGSASLEQRYRRLLRAFPSSWRRHREEEALSVLLEQAAAEERSTVGLGEALDLVGHGLEARLDSALRWLPWRLREQVASTALVTAAALSLLMLVGEVIGARYRPPAEELQHYGRYFISGPFLSIGVGIYLGFLAAALLCVLRRPGLSRLLLLLTTAYAAWMYREIGFGGYPVPRLVVLVLFVLLGVLAALSTIPTTSASRRRMIGFWASLVVVVAVGIALTKSAMGWSLGTITTSGNVALAVLATVLALVSALALVCAAVITGRHPGWLTATAVTIFPLVLVSTAVSEIVSGFSRPAVVLGTPLYYVLALVLGTLAHRQGRRRASTLEDPA